MPILILEKPEPLSEASRGQAKPMLVGSDAMRLLAHELGRYCRQEVTGRSFLIAGHRGSGKTTLVQGGFQQVLDQMAAEDTRDRSSLRPLLILLQGPNLLPGPPELEVTAAAATNAVGDVITSAGPSSEMENVLIQITLAARGESLGT